MKKYLSALAALALLFACTPEKTPGGDNNNNGGNTQPAVVDLTGITLSEHEITLEKGGNKVLEIKFTPANATNKNVTWVSSNTSVATVTDGVVVGVAPGSTEIIAKSGNFTDKCQVTVVISAKSISLNKTELAFKALNETETLVATLDPESSTGKIEWGSSDANVASVSPEGVVTSVAPGTAEITASCGSVFAKCAVTVEVAATSLSLDKNSLNLFIGDTETITATVLPENTTDQLTWSSSDEAIATVQDGVVTAVAAGTATITATAGEKTADCVVTVALPDSDIKVRYYGCRALGDHTDINIYADNQLVAADGFGIATLKKNWSSATAVVSGVEYNLEATDGASFSGHQYGNYYWTWAFKDSYVEAALENAYNEPVTIIMTDVNGGKYYLIYKENQSSSYSYYHYGDEESPKAVDLGLSVKWATCNLGAEKAEDFGDYYAWGETETKSEYTWINYKFQTSGDNSANVKYYKYITNSSYGPVDNKTVLEPEDDVAHVKLGGKWRMPTDAEWTELRTKCTWTWVKNYNGSGINGKLVTATNGNSIFLPAAGSRLDTNLYDAGSYGNYWSSSLSTDGPNDAWRVIFNSGDVSRSSYDRCYGLSVRPVTE